jgi:DNA-binding LytR/AlgR family response regulator
MGKKINQFINSLKDKFGLFISISLGIFLFVLFFQPFPIDHLDFNNKLIFVAGLAIIVFLLMVLVRIAFPWSVQDYARSKEDTALPYYTGGVVILALSAVAFAFYLRYVGSVSISFYIMFKIILICLVPPVSLWLSDAFKVIKQNNESLTEEINSIKQQVLKYKEDYQNVSIDFISDKSSENITLLISDVAFIRSANNYIEIVFMEDGICKKKLQRNTLRNIEQQLRPYANFIRCHRTCIVNAYYIEELSRKFNNHWLTLRGYDEPIPVSRQYLEKLREAI